MPAEYRLHPEKKLVFTRLFGPVNEQDLLNHIADMTGFFENGSLDRDWRQLVHVDEVGFIGKSPVGLIRHLAKINPWPPECRRVIASENNVTFGLSRIYQQLAGPDNPNLLVVKTLKEAQTFLNRRISGSS